MTNANMDWTQTGSGNPTGYTSAFRSGHLGPPHDTDVSYLLPDPTPNNNSHARTPYPNISGYHSHSSHLGSSLNAGLQASDFWTQQNDSSHNDAASNDPPDGEAVHDELAEPVEPTNSSAQEGGALDPLDPRNYTKAQLVAMPRSQRRKLYVIKPDPSEPRAFRPFQPFERTNTMLAEWSTPTIIGSYMMFPNKRLKYNPMPPDIDLIREKLFKCDESILLRNSQEVADYLPHVTNYWRRAVWRHEIDEDTGVQTEYWTCRQKRVKKPPKRPEGSGKGLRNRPKKSLTFFDEYEPCQMRLRVVSYTRHAKTDATHTHWGGNGGTFCKCIPEWVHLEKSCPEGAPEEHTHGHEIMDAWKRSEAVGVLAKLKCEEGNTYAAVSNWLRKEYGDVSKQVFKYEKGDVANAAKSWRETYRDLVLHDEVPEDTEEMITMRRCVDAIWEADADTLRTALREVIKDSDALTKTALAVLEEEKPAPVQEMPREPRLLEGVTVLDLPAPGAGEKLVEDSKIQGPPRTYLPGWRRDDQVRAENARKERKFQYMNAQRFSAALGPDGRPIPTAGVSRAPGRPRKKPIPDQPPAVVPPSQGASLQPRPTVLANSTPPQPHKSGEIRYVYLPAPLPTPQPQRGCVHPITFSMEVPSCSQDTCKQCKHMRRGTAGRTFYFQDKIHTPGHFQKLQNLLRNPQQLLHDDYTRSLHQSHFESVHPHPALAADMPENPEAHPSQRPNASSPDDVPSHQDSLKQQAKARMADVEALLRAQRNAPPGEQAQVHAQSQSPPTGAPPSQRPEEAQQDLPSLGQTQPQSSAAPPSTEAGGDPNRSADGETTHQHHQPAPALINDPPLPIPFTTEDDGEDEGSAHKVNDDDEQGDEAEKEHDDEIEGQPPAKRQRQLSAEGE